MQRKRLQEVCIMSYSQTVSSGVLLLNCQCIEFLSGKYHHVLKISEKGKGAGKIEALPSLCPASFLRLESRLS